MCSCKQGESAQKSRFDAFYDLDIINRAFDAVGDLLNPDPDIGRNQRDNISCLMMVLNKCMDQAIENVRNATGEEQSHD